MPNINDLLNLNIPDDVVIKLGDDMNSVRWGDLKAHIAGLAGERDTARNDANHWRSESQQLGQSVAQLLQTAANGAQQEQQNNNSQPQSPRDVLRAALSDIFREGEEKGDPYLDPMIDRRTRRAIEEFKAGELENLRREYTGKFDEYQRGLQLMAGQLGMERGMREYREQGEWPEGVDFAKASAAAIEQRIFIPGTTFPDYRRLNEQLMAPTRAERDRERIRQEERSKVETEFRSNFGGTGLGSLIMPSRPGLQLPNAPAPINTEGKDRQAIIEDALARGIEDALKEGQGITNGLPR